jgi:hypothetical protein
MDLILAICPYVLGGHLRQIHFLSHEIFFFIFAMIAVLYSIFWN